MSIIGNEAEQAVARALSAMGFDLVYQSRASRGAFDLLATRGAAQLGLQVKRTDLPLRFSAAEWSRMKADAERWGWRWVLVALDAEGVISVLDPDLASVHREVRVGREATIGNLVLWLDRRETAPSKSRHRTPTKA